MKLLYKANFWAIIFLIALSIPALKSLATPNFYTSHDGETHTVRIAQYYMALQDGQIPPRWAQTLGEGLGSPMFVYIYPTPYILGSFIHLLGFSYSDSFEILISLAFIFSAIFAYFWLKEVLHSPRAAFIGALFYVWVPYRFSLIYVRASISESLAYTFLPLLLFSITKLSQKQNLKWVSLSAVSLSLILLSQNLVAMMSLPVVGIYGLILLAFNRSPKFVLYSMLSVVLGFLLSAFTYFPVLFEREFIYFDQSFYLVYNSHFVTLGQLLHSPWDYGFDLPGTLNDSMSFQIGLAQILMFLISLILLPFVIFRNTKVINKLMGSIIDKASAFQIVVLCMFLVTFAVTIFLMLEIKPTNQIWKQFSAINIIDIPWRLLGITALASAVIAGFVVKSIRPAVVVVLLVAAVVIANRNHLRINKTLIYTDEFFENYTGTATQFNEFTPKSRSTASPPEGFNKNNKVEVIEGDVKVANVQFNSKKIAFDVDVKNHSRLQVNTIYFPGWHVYLDGQEQKAAEGFLIRSSIDQDPLARRNDSGLFELRPPMGNHRYEFKFIETPLRKAANATSFIALMVAIALLRHRAKNEISKS